MRTDQEDTTTSGLYHSTSQVLLARLYDNVLTTAAIRKTCSNCGQVADTDTTDDDEEEAMDLSESDESSSSTDIRLRLRRHYSQYNMNQKLNSENSNLQYSKSLSSLPVERVTGGHSKLARTGGTAVSGTPFRHKVKFSLFPELIYSDVKENNHQTNHQKLKRKDNVLAEIKTTVLVRENDTKSELTEEEKDDNNKESKAEDEEETDHYQSVKSGENLYSYAYRDSFSPAAMIKLEDCSDVSEDFYDSIKAPSETSRGDTVESVSEAGDMFLSISKGRRNYLKLHRHVGWDLERLREEEGSGDSDNCQGYLSHSRLLPLLIEEEKKKLRAENSAVRRSSEPKPKDGNICYYRYPQYKDVRNSKIRMTRRELDQVQSVNGLKEKLNLKKSLQRTFPENFSRISFFNGKKEARFNIKVSLQRKLTNMMSYIKSF